MSKYRIPQSFPAAVTRIMGTLSAEGCADVVGKSASLVRKWADPDADTLPGLEQALLLDMAYASEFPGEYPILQVYKAKCKNGFSYPSETGSLEEKALLLSRAAGAVSGAIVVARRLADGGMVAKDAYEIAKKLAEVKEQVNAIEQALSSMAA